MDKLRARATGLDNFQRKSWPLRQWHHSESVSTRCSPPPLGAKMKASRPSRVPSIMGRLEWPKKVATRNEHSFDGFWCMACNLFGLAEYSHSVSVSVSVSASVSVSDTGNYRHAVRRSYKLIKYFWGRSIHKTFRESVSEIRPKHDSVI